MKFNTLSHSITVTSTDQEFNHHSLGNQWLEKIFQGIDWGTKILFHFLLHGEEPRIQKIEHRDGSKLWQVYDPQTYRHAMFDTEEEVRIWLEERYYSATR